VNWLNHEWAEKQKPFYGETYLYSFRIINIVHIKVRFSFIHESIAEMAPFSISGPVKLGA